MAQTAKLIDINAVIDRTTESRSSIYRRVADGTFPKPVKIGPRKVGWVESEIEAHIASRIAERDGRAA